MENELFVTAREAAQVGKKILNETAANIIYWQIFIIFAGVVFTFVIIGICFVFIKLKEFYQDNCGDLISVMVATFRMALLVYFGDCMKGLISVNLIVIFLIQIVHVAVRYCVNAGKILKDIISMVYIMVIAQNAVFDLKCREDSLQIHYNILPV